MTLFKSVSLFFYALSLSLSFSRRLISTFPHLIVSWCYDEKEKSDFLVKSFRSLEEVIIFLNNSDLQGKEPWGSIQIVLHGNAWSGLSLPLQEGRFRATPKELLKLLVKNTLIKLDKDRIDSLTNVNFWGCGIGKNPIINLAMDSIFTDKSGIKPNIYTSPHYVIFKESTGPNAPRRLKASYWPYFYKRGYRPSDWTISKALKEQFPEETIDWQKALSDKIKEEGAPFHNSFHVPISWTLVYDDETQRPLLQSKEEK